MKVLVATDGSEHSMKAVKRGLALAEKEGANVTLLSVVYFAKEILDEVPLDIQERLSSEAENAIDKAKALFDKKGVKVTTLIETGVVPANNIIRKAEEGKFDMILVGHRGQTGLWSIMGSTAAKVAAHAPCSVTVVR